VERAPIAALSLDARLGLRMLAKYPGLTIVGVLGRENIVGTIVPLGTTPHTVIGMMPEGFEDDLVDLVSPTLR
jgi:hypothetical protein